MLISAVLFGVAFMSRYWLMGLMFGPWYYMDDALDSCIGPFQLSQGEGIWGGQSQYLVWVFYLMAYRLFGFGVEVARLTNIFFFAISVVVFYWALHRPFGRQVGWFVVGMMLLSSPFITHSIYATAITYCLLPTAIILFVLTRPLTLGSVAFLGPVLAAGLFLYPAAVTTGASIIIFHAIFFYRSWTWKTRLISLATLVLAGGLAYRIRLGVARNPDWKQWSGGILSFEGTGQRSMVILKDTFWESLSFGALNSSAPYFDTVMIGFLAIGVIAFLITSKFQPPMSDRKWIWISLLSFLGSVLLSGLASHYPGVRRIFSSLPLLFLIAGLGLKHFWRSKVFRAFLVATTAVCFSLVTLRSYAISTREWPTLRDVSRQDDFMVAARQTLVQNADSQKNVVLIDHNWDRPWSGQLYRCALSLDEELNGHFQTVTVIPQSQLGRKHDLQGRFILFTGELLSQDQLLNMFGHPPNSLKTLNLPKAPKRDQLIAIYEFAIDSVRDTRDQTL